jgi:erythromycin esterase
VSRFNAGEFEALATRARISARWSEMAVIVMRPGRLERRRRASVRRACRLRDDVHSLLHALGGAVPSAAVGILLGLNLSGCTPVRPAAPGLEDPAVVPAEAHARQLRIDDLRPRVVPVRTIDPADTDFSDLASLAEAIGDARIVQLGESHHGSGSAFTAKVRLVKFLHQELGFDVLLWESDMWGVRTVADSLRAGADPAASARLGIVDAWSESREVLPVFEYARDSHAGGRPLEMGGLDLQIFMTGRPAAELEADLLRFTGVIRDAPTRDTAATLIRRAVDRFGPLGATLYAYMDHVRDLRRAGVVEAMPDSGQAWFRTRQHRYAPAPRDLESFLAAADDLLEFLGTVREELAGAHGGGEVAFVGRVLDNFREYGVYMYENYFAGRPTQGPEWLALTRQHWNRRDARMAENLRWFAEERYPDRKLIVWAHNGHIMNAYYQPDWSSLAHDPPDGGMKPMGVFAAELLGTELYTIGFTGFAGETAWATWRIPRQVPEAPEESLESLLHELGHEQAFLDFRALPPDHWLRRPSTMAIRGYRPEVMEDWTRVVDGIFFIDRITAATPVAQP